MVLTQSHTVQVEQSVDALCQIPQTKLRAFSLEHFNEKKISMSENGRRGNTGKPALALRSNRNHHSSTLKGDNKKQSTLLLRCRILVLYSMVQCSSTHRWTRKDDP